VKRVVVEVVLEVSLAHISQLRTAVLLGDSAAVEKFIHSIGDASEIQAIFQSCRCVDDRCRIPLCKRAVYQDGLIDQSSYYLIDWYDIHDGFGVAVDDSEHARAEGAYETGESCGAVYPSWDWVLGAGRNDARSYNGQWHISSAFRN